MFLTSHKLTWWMPESLKFPWNMKRPKPSTISAIFYITLLRALSGASNTAYLGTTVTGGSFDVFHSQPSRSNLECAALCRATMDCSIFDLSPESGGMCNFIARNESVEPTQTAEGLSKFVYTSKPCKL